MKSLPVEEAVDSTIQYCLNVVEIKAEIQKIVLPVCHHNIFVDILHLRRLRRELKGVLSLKPGQILFQAMESILRKEKICL